jgi:hypothetical protein
MTNASDEEGLSRGERVWGGIIGGALLATGATSTFVGNNGIGSAALIIIGGALLLLGVTGQTLRKVKIGDNETEFYAKVGRRAVDAAESEAVDKSEREAARDLIEQVSETTRSVPARVLDISRGLEYEEVVSAAVKRATMNGEAKGKPATSLIAVEVKYRQAGRAPGPRSLEPNGNFRPLAERAARAGYRALLIVTNSAVGFDGVIELNDLADGKSLRVLLCQWTPDMGDGVLAEALARLSA